MRLNTNLVNTAIPPIPVPGVWARDFHETPEKPLINLAQGVPGSPPPQELLDRLAELARDQTLTYRYGSARGEIELREALAKDMSRCYGADIPSDNVAITAGCNLAFYAAILALAAPGDEVVLPCPWYFNHEMTLTQLGVTCVPMRTQPPAFEPSVDDLRPLLTERTRAVVLVTPNNPTGAIYSPETIAAFADIAKERHIALVLDETYRDFLPSKQEQAHTLFQRPDWRDTIVHLFSFSKSYAIPGLRLGACAGSAPLLEAIDKALDCLQICPARPAQHAAAWAVEGIRSWRQLVRHDLNNRGERFKQLMKEAPGWEIVAVGGYYAYVRHPWPGVSSEEVGERLAKEAGIMALPGSFFVPPGFYSASEDQYLRFSIANVPLERLALVPARLAALYAK